MSVTTISDHKWNESKSAASWNVTRSCLYHCHTTWSTAHAYYIILSKKFPLLKDLAESRSSRQTCHHQGLADNSEYATHADWVIDSNLALAILAYSTLHGRCHLVCVGPVQCYPGAWNFRQYCLIFLLNTDANMLCRLFDDHKHMDIYLHIHQEYCYLGKQKICLYFSASTCEHLWPSPSHLVICTKYSHLPSKDAADWSVSKVFFKVY